MASPSDYDVFSVRIVSLDYYMSPPIPDLDFCYSSFLGAAVEEVPVIRIYGATPAGQKTCLHVHRALPYFYVPFPDDLLQSPEEGHAFIHALSSGIEKVLRHKSNSTPKRLHVHACSLVRAKRLYGYYSSEELFMKVYLYHPHDIARAASLLLDGAVLGKSFQPYESHIPYLLQFLVDYNLYGMSHLHASIVKFRSPVPDFCSAASAKQKNYDTPATLSSHTGGKPKIWLSSTIPTSLVWPDSTSSHDNKNIKYIHLTRRQSLCGLEADASVEDIINVKSKIYTSLSQTSSDVRMVQSLVPIWEEECERSGIQEGAKQDDPNKPLPEDALRSFMHGFDYDRSLSQLCMEICNFFPSKVHVVDEDEKLNKYIKSYSDISRKIEPFGGQGYGSPCDAYLVRGEDGSRGTSSSLSFIKEDLKSPDIETLGLLSWLASSQAEEELDAGDELLHEAILSPLLPAKSYREAFEIAHRDYEHASQLECQDILDSVEGIVKSKGPKEQSSLSSQNLILDSFQGILKPEGSKEHASSSFLDHFDAASSGSLIPQVDGSFDNNCQTPEKGNISETNMSCGEEIATAKPVGKGPKIGSKSNENKLLWGTLPFSISKCEPEVSKLFCHISSFDTMINDGFYDPSFHHKEGSCYDLKNDCDLKNDIAICSEKGGKALTLCSVRDLMRKKRCPRVEQAEAEVQKNEDMTSCWNEGMAPCQTEELTSNANNRGGLHSVHGEELSLQQSASHQNVLGSVACSTICSSGFQGTEGFEHRSSCCYSPTFQNSFSSLMTDTVQSRIVASDLVGFNQRSTLKEQIKISGASMKLAAGDLSMREAESNKLYTAFSGVCKVEGPSSPPNIMNHHSTNQKEKSVQNETLKSLTHENYNTSYVENMYAIKDDGDIAHGLRPNIHPGSCQQFTSILDDDSRHFGKEKTSQEFIKMTFVSKPPTNAHIHGSEETSVADQLDGDIDKRPGMDTILPFFPKISQRSDSYDENVSWSTDYAPGVPTHFQNDGTVLYLLTHALSPPTFNSVNDWLLGGIKQHCLLDSTGASKECLDTCSDGVVNEASPPIKVGRLEYDASQSSEERCSLEPEKFHPNICNFSSEPKVGICPAKEKVISDHLHDLSQISGPEKYANSYPTPLSQIGFRDPASVGGGQQLTLISMELQAESRGDLRPDPKFDAINVLSLVVQEDASNMHQVYVLLRVFDEKPGEKNGYGVFDCNLFLFPEEKLLLEHFVEIISSVDPDILMGWEIQCGSLGYLAERALHLGMNLLKKISRTPFHDPRDKLKDSGCPELSNVLPDVSIAKTVLEDLAIEDEWGRNHASGVHVGGRIVLNVWRLMRSELKLNIYTAEAVAERVLRLKIPLFSNWVLNQWYSSGLGTARYKCIEYVIHKAKLNIQIMDQLDLINRTSELARVFGIDFFSVISRGSQYRVESMLLRLAHTQNYLAISPGYQQVASQPAMECLPLVMEPESGFYIDPVVVLDFQSLYPSMIIAYNLCYCTCLGNVTPSRANVLGISSYSPDIEILRDLREKLLLTPNGIMYVPSKIRKGVLPRLLEEILSTRVMVKQAMKKLTSSQQVLHRILNARQLALKLIANVTYGYTAAGFSGRMPCAEIADSIVQCGRRTLETAISFVNQHKKWKAKVIYGDTDSMFVLLKGRSKDDAFRIGHEIACAITTMNPEPVTLKMEKVYQPCFLLTKKRYVGYSYEYLEQEKPTFDAKGIETIRRDTCPAVAKILERSIRLMFESQNLSEVKSYLQRQWSRILSGKISLNDFVFAKEVRLGTYSSRAASLPPAAIVAMKDMQFDPRAEPCYGERVPYVVIHGEPGSRLMDMVVNPFEILDINSPYRLNDLYYINKQIIPALQRVFGLLGADVKQWFSEIPRPTRPMLAKRHTPKFIVGPPHDDDNDNSEASKKPQAKRSRIDTYYSSKHCSLCGELIHSSDYFCAKCSKKESLVSATVVGRTSKKESQMKHLAEICSHCGGGDWIVESGVKCISLACSVFYERRKAQKELLVLSSFAKAVGLYPSCNAELF